MFIDEAKIRAKPAMAATAACLPAGENSSHAADRPAARGKAGDVWMESSERHNTLVHFRFNRIQRQRDDTARLQKTGRDGEGIVLKVPSGRSCTTKNWRSGSRLRVFRRPHRDLPRRTRWTRQRAVRNPRPTSPRDMKTGVQEKSVISGLELKLLADVVW